MMNIWKLSLETDDNKLIGGLTLSGLETTQSLFIITFIPQYITIYGVPKKKALWNPSFFFRVALNLISLDLIDFRVAWLSTYIVTGLITLRLSFLTISAALFIARISVRKIYTRTDVLRVQSVSTRTFGDYNVFDYFFCLRESLVDSHLVHLILNLLKSCNTKLKKINVNARRKQITRNVLCMQISWAAANFCLALFTEIFLYCLWFICTKNNKKTIFYNDLKCKWNFTPFYESSFSTVCENTTVAINAN